MKKLVSLFLVLVLALALSGCSLNEPDIVNEGDTIIEYNGEPVYTQEEVDEIINNLKDEIKTMGVDITVQQNRIKELERLPNPNLCDYKNIFRVEIIEEVQDNIYIVGKSGYTTQSYFQIYTEQELTIGKITQVAVYKDNSAVLFNELICVVSFDKDFSKEYNPDHWNGEQTT